MHEAITIGWATPKYSGWGEGGVPQCNSDVIRREWSGMNRICTSRRESVNHPMLRGTGMFPELLFPESSPSDLAEELWEPAQVRVLGGPCCAPSLSPFVEIRIQLGPVGAVVNNSRLNLCCN